jgi:hypothetical protein
MSGRAMAVVVGGVSRAGFMKTSVFQRKLDASPKINAAKWNRQSSK